MELLDLSLRRKSVLGWGGRVLTLASAAIGANHLVVKDESVLFCDDAHGNRLWTNDDLPLQAFDRHDDLLALIKSDPARFVPDHVPHRNGVMFPDAD